KTRPVKPTPTPSTPTCQPPFDNCWHRRPLTSTNRSILSKRPSSGQREPEAAPRLIAATGPARSGMAVSGNKDCEAAAVISPPGYPARPAEAGSDSQPAAFDRAY